MLRIFLPYFSILWGQYLPDCHKKQLSKSAEKSNFLPEAGGQLGPDYPHNPGYIAFDKKEISHWNAESPIFEIGKFIT